MIPPVVMYVLAALLGTWGAYRLYVGRKPDAKGRGGHLVFGVLYLLMAAYLILTTARVIPPPRIFGGPPPAPAASSAAQPVHVMPLAKIPTRPTPPASAPAATATPQPAATPSTPATAPAK